MVITRVKISFTQSTVSCLLCVDWGVTLCSLIRTMMQVRIFDPATNRWTVTHPLRTAYYSFISAVLFFLPIVTMTVAYVLIIWKLWSSKRPGEALGPELKTYDKVKKRVNSF